MQLQFAEAAVGVARPGGELIGALAAQEIVVAFAAEEPVQVRRLAEALAGVAPELVVAAIAEDRVAAAAAVDPVAGPGAIDRVVARTGVDRTDPVGAPVGEVRHEERSDRRRRVADGDACRGTIKAERVVAIEAADGKLLDPRRARFGGRERHAGITPGGRDQLLARACLHIRHELVLGVLAEQDRVVVDRAVDDEDVGGSLVSDVVVALIAVVAVERLGLSCVLSCVERIPRVDVEHQLVDAFAAVEFIGPRLALQPVAVGAAPEFVVAGVAIELVLAGAAVDYVGTAPADVCVFRVVLAIDGVALHRVGACVAVDRFAADAAVDPVAAGAAVHLVALELRLGLSPGLVGHAVRPAVEAVDPAAAKEPLILDDLRGIVGRACRQRAAVAEESILAVVAEYLIDAGTPRHAVVVATTADGIVSCVAVDRVVARTAVDIVGVITAADRVVAAAAKDPVGALAAGDAIVAISYAAIDRAARQTAGHDPLHALGDCPLAAGEVCGEVVGCARGCLRLELRQVDPPLVFAEAGITAPDRIAAIAAGDGVVAGAASDEVVAIAPGERVASRFAIHAVVAGQRIDDVSPEAGADGVGAPVAVDHVDECGLTLARRCGGGVVEVTVDQVAILRRRRAAADCRFSAVDRVAACPADNRVGAESAADLIVACAAADRVSARVAPDHVVVGRRKKCLGAGHDDVDPGIAVDRVITATGVDCVLRVGIGG